MRHRFPVTLLFTGSPLPRFAENDVDCPFVPKDVLDRWVENPYWQAFCGGEFFEHEPPTDQTVMSRWRKRAGEAGVTAMIMETLASAVRNKVAKAKDFERVNVDTTVQEKNVRFPTDARTLDRARERIVDVGEKLGIGFRRNYVRKGKTMLRKHSGYVKAKQFNRAENAVRAMKRYLQNVVDDAERCQIVPRNARQMALLAQLANYVALSKKLIAQDKNTPGKEKIYSVHEPQVECIAKGKVHKRYEFGVKAGFVTASRTTWVLGAMALPGNPYDGNTLTRMLEQAVGFNLVKLMRGLKRLFLCLRMEGVGFAAFLVGILRMVACGGLPEPVVLRYPRKIANRGFA